MPRDKAMTGAASNFGKFRRPSHFSQKFDPVSSLIRATLPKVVLFNCQLARNCFICLQDTAEIMDAL
jgi:hypothetical protein